MTDNAEIARVADISVREASAGKTGCNHDLSMFRSCHGCGACFLCVGQVVKTGLRGLWNSDFGMRWYCSRECAPERVTSPGAPQ